MVKVEKSCEVFNSEKTKGRERLVTDVDGKDISVILEDIKKQSSVVNYNSASSKYLWDFVKGNQPILERVDDTNGASSNNKVVINFAVSISRILLAHTFPNGLNYLSKSSNEKFREFAEKLNNMMCMKSNNVAAQEMKWYQSVCGHTFLYVNYDKNNTHGVPFTVQTIEPWNAYVVYSMYNKYEPVYGVIKYPNGSSCIFTKTEFFVVNSKSEVTEQGVHLLGEVPVIEVRNNTLMMGDFEIVLSALNAINNVTSDSVNNVEDIVKAYLVLIGVDEEDAKKLDFTKGSVLALSGQQGVNQSAQFIHSSLDGTSVNQLRTFLTSATKFVAGVPDRDTDNEASSTGVSEDIKTGQADKDAIANEKTIYVEEAQRRVLEIIFNILRAKNPEIIPDGMTAANIDIDITRANRDNILTKSQAMLNLKQIGLCNEDVIYFGNITNDVAGVSARMVSEDESDSEDDLNAALERVANEPTTENANTQSE